MKCPFCRQPLEELFDVLELQQYHQLVSSNMWACRQCGYGKNRFRADGSLIDFANGEEE